MMSNTVTNDTINSSKEVEQLLGYSNIKPLDYSGEKALWQSVIMQAALDAISNPKDIQGKMERARTISWFNLENEDFLLVCSFAQMDPHLIMRGVKNAVRRHRKNRGRKNISCKTTQRKYNKTRVGKPRETAYF